MYASGRRKEKENADWDYDDSEYPSYSVKEETSIFLMTGPRGSGKSTCLLGIREKRGQKPTIFLSLGELRGTTLEAMQESWKDMMRQLYADNQAVMDERYISAADLKVVKKMLTSDSDIVLWVYWAASFLLKALCACYHQKVLVLVDDYDLPILEGLRYGYHREAIGFVSSILNAWYEYSHYIEGGCVACTYPFLGKGIFFSRAAVQYLRPQRRPAAVWEREIQHLLEDYITRKLPDMADLLMPLLNGDPVSFKLEDYISMDERGLKGKQDFLRVILAGQKGRLNEEDGTTEVAGRTCRDLLQRLTLAAIAGYFRLPNMMFPGMSQAIHAGNVPGFEAQFRRYLRELYIRQGYDLTLLCKTFMLGYAGCSLERYHFALHYQKRENEYHMVARPCADTHRTVIVALRVSRRRPESYQEEAGKLKKHIHSAAYYKALPKGARVFECAVVLPGEK